MRPQPSEHAPYYGRYIALVPDGDLFALYGAETAATRAVLGGISEQRSLHRYAPGKWSLRESLLHLADTERIFAYRALRFARGDQQPLPGIEAPDYVAPSAADSRSFASLVAEYEAVRGATVALFENLPAAAWDRGGIASDWPFTVRALAYIILGHDIHHRKIFVEKYLA
jgi:DinB superfamily